MGAFVFVAVPFLALVTAGALFGMRARHRLRALAGGIGVILVCWGLVAIAVFATEEDPPQDLGDVGITLFWGFFFGCWALGWAAGIGLGTHIARRRLEAATDRRP